MVLVLSLGFWFLPEVRFFYASVWLWVAAVDPIALLLGARAK
jgi:uncharacterized membrane protein